MFIQAQRIIQLLKIILQLIEQADIVVENFRPGVMERLGYGYGALKKINPKIKLSLTPSQISLTVASFHSLTIFLTLVFALILLYLQLNFYI